MTGAPGGPPEPVGVGFAADEGGGGGVLMPSLQSIICTQSPPPFPPGEAGLGGADQYQHFHNKCAEYS